MAEVEQTVPAAPHSMWKTGQAGRQAGAVAMLV